MCGGEVLGCRFVGTLKFPVNFFSQHLISNLVVILGSEYLDDSRAIN